MPRAARLASLWRGDHEARRTVTPHNNRFAVMFDALTKPDVRAEPGPRPATTRRRQHASDSTYVLCEINVSSVVPFPDAAAADIARLALARCRPGHDDPSVHR